MKLFISAMLLAIAGCGGSSGTTQQSATCSLGHLSGTWRFHFDQTDGNCGALADVTSIESVPSPSAGAGCTVTQKIISADACREDVAYQCSDGSSAVLVIKQTSPTQLAGTGTFQGILCRSTYNITGTEL